MLPANKSLLLALLALLTLCLPIVHSQNVNNKATSTGGKRISADTVFINGNFITMAEKEEKIEFVAIRDEKIIGVGSKGQMGPFVGKNTHVVDLFGQTMMPGIIDSHSHFGNTACKLSQGFDISPPPFGTVTSIPQLLDSIRTYIATSGLKPGKTVSGFGYSDVDLAEGRHPTRYDLDSVSTEHPIVIIHSSNHIAVGNSLALEKVNYLDPANLPAEGVDKFENGTITGVCRQWAALPLVNAFGLNIWNLTREQLVSAAQTYFSCGVTTAQDMILTQKVAATYRGFGEDFPIDINGYYWISAPDLDNVYRIMEEYRTSAFKIRGGKFILDGSIQGYTALLTHPYWVPKSKSEEDLTDYVYDDERTCKTEKCGLDNFPDKELLKTLIRSLLQKGIDIHAHCNGDAASDNMINAVQSAKNGSYADSDSRVAMIHAQTVREDQLDRMIEVGIFPSFFPLHLYYWGDKHYQIFLGPDRANRMDPVGSAFKRGMKFTLHTDSPTVIVGIAKDENTFLKLISTAVTRKTSGGRVLDDGTLKISVYEAIKALTITSAWQSREQAIKGSIQVGKLADLIIINGDPLTMDLDKLDTLKVLATIKQGELVFGDYHFDSNPRANCKPSE